MVPAQALSLAGAMDGIVLAQASMQRLVPRLEEETGRVLSSPRPGVDSTRASSERRRRRPSDADAIGGAAGRPARVDGVPAA